MHRLGMRQRHSPPSVRAFLASSIVAGLGLVAACSGARPDNGSDPADAAPTSNAPLSLWSFEAAANGLRAASCPDGAGSAAPEAFALEIEAISLGDPGEQAAQLDRVDLAGAWVLSSDRETFGGLSGLAIRGRDTLLAVSDAGLFVTLALDPQTGAPTGEAGLAPMTDAEGRPLTGKRRGDAEGLALRDGLALVSFERDHRILAFDLEGCGATAAGALVARLPDRIGEDPVGDNRGPEALTLTGEGHLQIGYELGGASASPVGTLLEDGTLAAVERLAHPLDHRLTGLDSVTLATGERRRVALYRAYDPVRGNRILVQILPPEALVPIAAFTLQPPLAVDNFEGVATRPLPDGRTRLYLIADDNFNDSQRTLLFAFDFGVD